MSLILSVMIYGFYYAELVRIVDADTFEVKMYVLPGLTYQTKLRIAGINTPEKRGSDCEKQAAKESITLAEGILHDGKFIVGNIKNGKYAGRVVGDLYVGGVSYADLMLETGYAVKYDGGKREKWC